MSCYRRRYVLSNRELDQARRRKWIRTRAPKPLPYDDPFRPLYLVWEVTATPQGHMEVRRSLRLGNMTTARCVSVAIDGFRRSCLCC